MPITETMMQDVQRELNATTETYTKIKENVERYKREHPDYDPKVTAYQEGRIRTLESRIPVLKEKLKYMRKQYAAEHSATTAAKPVQAECVTITEPTEE